MKNEKELLERIHAAEKELAECKLLLKTQSREISSGWFLTTDEDCVSLCRYYPDNYYMAGYAVILRIAKDGLKRMQFADASLDKIECDKYKRIHLDELF